MIDPENLKKMSKDEIIECCSNIADWGFNDYDEWEQQSAVYGLLDLYKKQQKEIEELRKVINVEKVMCENMIGDVEIVCMYKDKFLSYYGDDYISKDKVRDKIEELEEIADEDNLEEYAKIDILKEMLEENNNENS